MTPAHMALTHAAAFSRSRPWSEAEFAGLLQNPACFVVGTRRCFALIRLIAPEAELLTIATHPASHRQGLARACMSRWQAGAADRGAARALLEVAADNQAAISLYRSCGYEVDTIRSGYYRRTGTDPVDALMMVRPLP